jgi:hypothetical protein
MKKLALALMCLVSVAFFASCTKPVENPEPAIALMTGENFVYDGQTIDLYADYNIGFRAASNSQTMKELASFTLVGKIFDVDDTEIYTEDTTFTISGTEYVYQEVLNFGTRDLVGKVTFVATVTDVDGKSNDLTINLNINQPAQPLFARPIEWIRSGQNVESATETDLASMGLRWTGSYRDIMATIRPLENADVTLYLCPGDDYDEITTDVEKAAYFANLSENPDAQAIDKYRNISAEQSHNYNDLLAVVYNGGSYLIHITHAKIDNLGSAGTKITITGETK